MKFVTQSYYEILDVPPDAGDDQIRRAYRQSRRTFQPDSMAIYSLYAPEESEAIAAKIDEAFQILTDRERRRRYDRYLGHRGREAEVPRDPIAFHEAAGEPLAPPERGIAGAFAGFAARGASAFTWPESVIPDAGDSRRGGAREVVPDPPRSHDLPDSWSLPGEPSDDEPRGVEPGAEEEGRGDPRRTTSGGLAGWTRESVKRLRGLAGAPTEPLVLRPIPPDTLRALEADLGLGGGFLRRVRELRGVDLQVIAERTKISLLYLKFIEDENFSDLPAPIYLRGFLQQLTRLLDLPEQRTVDGFMARYRDARG